MKELRMKLFAAILFLAGMTTTEAQTLRGTVTDAISGEALIGATVKVVEARDVGLRGEGQAGRGSQDRPVPD